MGKVLHLKPRPTDDELRVAQKRIVDGLAEAAKKRADEAEARALRFWFGIEEETNGDALSGS